MNDSPVRTHFTCKQTNQNLTPNPMALLGSYTALITTGLGIRQLRTAPTDLSSIKLFKLVHPKPASLPCSFIQEKATAKAFHSSFPSSLHLLPSTDLGFPSVSLHGVPLFALGTVSNKWCFQWQSSPDQLALPYLIKTSVCVCLCMNRVNKI